MARQFSKIHDIRGMKCKEGAAYDEVMYSKMTALGVRIMRATRHGTIKKTYFVRFTREEDGVRRQVKENLCTFDEISLEDAILRANKIIAQQNKNSPEYIAGRRTRTTIRDAFDLFVKTRKDEWAAATLDDYNKKFKHLRDIEHLRMVELDMRFWEARYEELKNRAPIAAKKVAKLVVALYRQEKMEAPLTDATVRQANTKGEKRTNHIDEDKIKIFWHYLHTHASAASRDFALVILFMGFRLSLVGNLSWSRVDLENKTYKIDKDDVGNKMKKAMLVPIPQYLIDNVFLPRLHVKNGDYVIESTKRKGTALASIKEMLIAASNRFDIDITHHSLRRTFSTYAQRSSRDTITVASLMLHTMPENAEMFRQTLDYIITNVERMREVSEMTSEYIQKLVKKQGT